ncbi:MAG: hypothetical protein M1819_002467 [Sarea resinae]|nr:MAG: hypothetical protein M1819_002467 [Sarea resinae]
MASFFETFAKFEPDPTASLEDEFKRLALQRNWVPGKKAFRKNRALCYSAEFATHYGSDASKLETWQGLCREVQIKEIPASIKKCKKVLKSVNVNLVDLVNCRRTGAPVQLFPSRTALREYSMENDKIFPRKAAKADGFIKALLIVMF